MAKEKYDSRTDTLLHIKRVNELLHLMIKHLLDRGNNHDTTKLDEPEKEIFDKYTPMLKNCTYGDEDYEKYIEEMQDALKHHYARNPHHPEYYEHGIDDMTLIDLIEMFVDWKASSERHLDGNIRKSIKFNKERFEMSDQLEKILINTIRLIEGE